MCNVRQDGQGGGGAAPLRGLPADDFLRRASEYRANGWHPIPVGRIDPRKPGKSLGKVPWLRGRTGRYGQDADLEEISTWPGRIAARIAKGEAGVLGLGVRFPIGVLGLDVDTYDGKRGAETLAHHERELGKLPPTYRITAREYATGSGIRLYRVPDDYRGPASLPAADGGTDSGVELIDRIHRFAVVPPTIHHTGNPYRLYDPDGREITPGVLPPVHDLPDMGTV